MTVHVTLEMTEEQKVRLEQLAAGEGVGVPEYLLSIVDREVRRDPEWVALIQEGVEFAETRVTFSHDDVALRGAARAAGLKAASKT